MNINEKRTVILDPEFNKVTIKFDGLSSAVEENKCIPASYRGLKWTDFSYMHKSHADIKFPKSGYVTSFTPGGSQHIAFSSKEVSIGVEMLNETITLVSVTACAAWNDDLQLTITGHRHSTQINAHTATLLFGQPKPILLQWKNIDKIIFQSSGGTAHPGSGGSTGLHVIFTELTITPTDLNNTG